jgi:BlaI family penicillinase repressor
VQNSFVFETLEEISSSPLCAESGRANLSVNSSHIVRDSSLGMCDTLTYKMNSLNQNELEALRIMWERGTSKPAEIQEHFAWKIDNGTLRSTLVSLVEKKHASRKRQGKAFFYSARVPKATALQVLTRNLARIFAGGSTRELVAQLVDTTGITADDLKIIRETAAGKAPRN